MREPWTEKVDGSVLEINLEGFDADKQDALEAKAMVDATLEDVPKPSLFWRSWSGSTLPLAGVFLLGGTLLGFLFVKLASGAFPDEYGDNSLGAMLQVLTFFSGFVVPIALVARFLNRRPAALAFATERFTLRLDATDLTISSATSPTQRTAITDIAEFHGDRRLSIVKTDGTRHPLLVSLLAAKRHPELAARLNDALRDTRARIGGYRGPRVAIAEEGSPDGEEQDVKKERRVDHRSR